MRKLIFALPALLLLASCGGGNTETATTTTEQAAASHTGDEFTIDTTATAITWKAAHKGGLAPRWGNINVSSGAVFIESDSLKGGEFVISMASLHVDSASVSEKDKKASDLEGHLKSADFFDVANMPTAKFQITKVEPFTGDKSTSLQADPNYLISGNLTLKDSTLNVTFPAKVEVTGSNVVANAKFIIDRTAWGLNYKTEGSPENWAISKDVEVGFSLKAAKK